MAKFRFQTVSRTGEIKTGAIEAADTTAARRELNKDGQLILNLASVKEEQKYKDDRKFQVFSGKTDFVRFCGDLSILLDAGLSLEQALSAIIESETNASQQAIVSLIREGLVKGGSVKEAFSSFPGITADSLALVSSGDASGQLPLTMQQLSKTLQEQNKRRKEFVDALIYPIFLIFMLVVALCVIMFVLVPAIEPVFEASPEQPPLIITVLSLMRTVLLTNGDLIGGGVVLIALMLLVKSFRQRLFNLIYRAFCALPIVNTIVRKMALARYLNSLAILISNSVNMTQALELATSSVRDPTMKRKLESVSKSVINGERLPSAFKESRVLPPKIAALVAVGDEANSLGSVLLHAAAILEDEVRLVVNRFLTMMTPVITILIGGLVGGLVITVMGALLDVNEFALQ